MQAQAGPRRSMQAHAGLHVAWLMLLRSCSAFCLIGARPPRAAATAEAPLDAARARPRNPEPEPKPVPEPTGPLPLLPPPLLPPLPPQTLPPPCAMRAREL